MPANIEQFADGTAAFVSARIPAWHQLGTVTPDALDAKDAIRLGGLDWLVEKKPVTATITIQLPEEITMDGVTPAQTMHVEVPGKFATVRKNPVDGTFNALGVVGASYTVVQNHESAAFLDALVDEGGAHFETAGSLDGGRRTFVSMKMPEGVKVGGTDPVNLYLLASNSHDGSSAFTVTITPTRVVCANTLAVALRHHRAQIKIRHTSGATQAILEARRVLGVTFDYGQEFATQMDELIAAPYTTRQFEGLVEKIWTPTKHNKGFLTKQTITRQETLGSLWRQADTQDVGRGTKWGAFNAVAEYVDHFYPVAKGDKDLLARRVLTGETDNPKAHALAILND